MSGNWRKVEVQENFTSLSQKYIFKVDRIGRIDASLLVIASPNQMFKNWIIDLNVIQQVQ